MMQTTTHTKTSFSPQTVWLKMVPNLSHPVFAEAPERAEGINAAINYLYSKRILVDHDYIDCNQQMYIPETMCQS
jgi:hypothetical protein